MAKKKHTQLTWPKRSTHSWHSQKEAYTADMAKKKHTQLTWPEWSLHSWHGWSGARQWGTTCVTMVCRHCSNACGGRQRKTEVPTLASSRTASRWDSTSPTPWQPACCGLSPVGEKHCLSWCHNTTSKPRVHWSLDPAGRAFKRMCCNICGTNKTVTSFIQMRQ